MKFILIVCFLIADSLISAAPTVNKDEDCVCGGEIIKSRIKNGHKVKGHKYPWMVQIHSFTDRDEGNYFQCGGSLIDNKHIITAAHCFEIDNKTFIGPDDVDIYMGTNNIGDAEEAYQVSKIWIDPDYDGDLLSNDLAIITLTDKVDFNRYISPICLPTTVDGLEEFTIAGWGRTGSRKFDFTSSQLLETMVDLVPRDQCEQLLLNWLEKTESEELKSADFNITEAIAETHLCAINKVTGGDACSGDSGGPLMYLGQDDRWYLIGVVSGSWEECGVDKDAASFYTQLIYYQQTIKNKAPSACWRDP